MIRDKEDHQVTTKVNCRGDTTVLNMYAPNNGAPKYMRQNLTERQGKIQMPCK